MKNFRWRTCKTESRREIELLKNPFGCMSKKFSYDKRDEDFGVWT